MTDSLISRIESLLAQIEALEERATKGEWLRDDTSTVRNSEGWIIAEVLGGGAGVSEMLPNSMLIAFQHNHSKTERELVRQLLDSIIDCDYCDRTGEVWSSDWTGSEHPQACTACDAARKSLTRWADSTEAELGKVEGR